MKKHVVRSVLALTILFGVVATAGAQTLPGSGWFTSATIQNVGADGTVNLDVYPLTGVAGAASTASFSLAAGANKVFLPGAGGASGTVDVAPSLASNFSGSMVVSSDQPVVAIGQIGNNPIAGVTGLGVTGGNASEQYRGGDAVSNVIIFPTVKSNFGGKTNIFYVQAGGTDVTFSAAIKTADGSSHTKTGAITANHSILISPADFAPAIATTGCGTDPNTSPCFGSLTVVGNNNIAGVALEYEDGKSPATAVQAASLFGTEDIGSTVLCPIMKNDFAGNHRTTGMSIANTGTDTANVTATFTSSTGATFTQGPQAITAGKSFVFSAFNNTVGGMPAGTLAAAKVISDKPTIAGVVSERNISGAPVKFTTYTCFNPANATAKIAAPVFKKDFGNNTTGIQVQNANTTGDVTVNATFSCDAGTTTFGPVSSGALAPGASFNYFRPAAVPANKLCAVTLDATGTNKIVAIMNESSDLFPGTVQFNLNSKNYEGFNL